MKRRAREITALLKPRSRLKSNRGRGRASVHFPFVEDHPGDERPDGLCRNTFSTAAPRRRTAVPRIPKPRNPPRSSATRAERNAITLERPPHLLPDGGLAGRSGQMLAVGDDRGRERRRRILPPETVADVDQDSDGQARDGDPLEHPGRRAVRRRSCWLRRGAEHQPHRRLSFRRSRSTCPRP